MSRESRKKKVEHFAHDYEQIDREIPGLRYHYLQCTICNQVIFPFSEAQKLYDYSRHHLFMFIHDWILALLYAQDSPIVGITSFMKQLFLVLMEFAPEHDIPTENPGFRAYKFGPYDERIEDVINGLEDSGIIVTKGRKGTKGEYFSLTEEGRGAANRSFMKLAPEQRSELIDKRLGWDQAGADGLMRYIYKKYPEFAENSLVLDRILHRRRLGKIKWEEGR